MATKKPLCLYTDTIKELQPGDTLPGGGAAGGGATILSAVLSADFSKTNDALANVAGLSLTLEAGKKYRVVGRFDTDCGTGGIQIDFAGGIVAPLGVRGVARLDNFSNDLRTSLNLNGLDTAPFFTPDGTGCYAFDFTIEVDTGGTLIPRFAQAVTDASASVLQKYSTIQAVEIA